MSRTEEHENTCMWYDDKVKTDERLIAQTEDKIRQADDWGAMTSSDFLDTHQCKVVSDYLRGCGKVVLPEIAG